MNGFKEIFGTKSLLGMLHLAGQDRADRVKRALDEARTYERAGFQGVIVEDYHGNREDVEATLLNLKRENFGLRIGVNVLSNPYSAFELAHEYDAAFVQFDTIQTSGTDTRNPRKFNENLFYDLRLRFPEIVVVGGVRFKYIPPTGRSLEEDITHGIARCDAVCTTGEGTGIATPTDKLRTFRDFMGSFPLVVGAGVNAQNISEQMRIVDAAIIGSYVKNGNTQNPVQEDLAKRLVRLAKS